MRLVPTCVTIKSLRLSLGEIQTSKYLSSPLTPLFYHFIESYLSRQAAMIYFFKKSPAGFTNIIDHVLLEQFVNIPLPA